MLCMLPELTPNYIPLRYKRKYSMLRQVICECQSHSLMLGLKCVVLLNYLHRIIDMSIPRHMSFDIGPHFFLNFVALTKVYHIGKRQSYQGKLYCKRYHLNLPKRVQRSRQHSDICQH